MIPTSEQVKDFLKVGRECVAAIRTDSSWPLTPDFDGLCEAQHRATLASLTPEGDVLEAAAKAMYATRRGFLGMGEWDSLDEYQREEWRKYARAAALVFRAEAETQLKEEQARTLWWREHAGRMVEEGRTLLAEAETRVGEVERQLTATRAMLDGERHRHAVLRGKVKVYLDATEAFRANETYATTVARRDAFAALVDSLTPPPGGATR